MTKIKETSEIYNEYYTNILIPYITRKISVYALSFDEKVYPILFRFDIHTLHDFLAYIEKPDYSIIKKLLSKSFDRDIMYGAIEQILCDRKNLAEQFYTKAAPEIMDQYDGIVRVMDTLPIGLYSDSKKFKILKIKTIGDLHRTLLAGNKECEIELVDHKELRDKYQTIYQTIKNLKEEEIDEEEIGHYLAASKSYQKKK